MPPPCTVTPKRPTRLSLRANMRASKQRPRTTFWLLRLLGGLAILSACTADDQPIAFPREFRGAWVASVENIDWPSRPGLDVATLKQEFLAILETARQLNLNAIVFQVRPCADAFYRSELEPWSEYLMGEMGKQPPDAFDPLSFAIAEAHARGLELHAWLNPYRAHHAASSRPLNATHIGTVRPELVRAYGKYLWLDPGEKEATAHTLEVVADIVKRYDVDGIHLDDYFYPYPQTDAPFPDDASWAKAQQNGTKLSRDDWRRENVNHLIREVRKTIQAARPFVRFGVSPFGIWRPGHPPAIQGFDPYAQLYADSRRWLQEGWVDYLAPQLYWSTGAPHQGYADLLTWWHQQNSLKRHLWPGNFTSRLLDDSERGWKAEELARQIQLTREIAGQRSTGNIHFSMKALQRNADRFGDRLREDLYSTPALVPETTWLVADPPPGFTIQRSETAPDSNTTQLRMLAEKSPWLWAIIFGNAGQRRYQLQPGHTRVLEIPDFAWDWVQIQAVNQLGICGPAVTESL